jgi:peptidoglycan-N-acetylglucosamine deacetylase
MTAGSGSKGRFSMAAWCGFGALALAALMFPFSRVLAVAPLAAFLLLCFTAPFMPALGFFLPVISRGTCTQRAVALTFDDGPDPHSTPVLLALLANHRAKATFFVTGKRALRYPEIIADILAQGHTLGNHSHSHDNFIMCKSSKALLKEIQDAQQVFHQMGVTPRAFRPPVGITNPKLGKVLEQVGMYALNFNRRAGDLGNRRIKHLSKRILKGIAPNDIIMLHDIKPRTIALSDHWLMELGKILEGIKERELLILSLEELIGKPVMERVEKRLDAPG